MKTKVILMGGTGAIGCYLSEVLAGNGFDVFCTTRRAQKNTSSIRYIVGDAHDTSFIKYTIESIKPDAIVDFM